MSRSLPRWSGIGVLLALFLGGCVAPAARGTADAPQTSFVVKPIRSGDGAYVSPIKADGTLAPWVTEGAGRIDEFQEYVDGKNARAFLLPLVPNMFIEMYGDKKAMERIVNAFGGWDYIRKTSDVSFNTISDLVNYINSFGGRDARPTAWAAASWLYPEFVACTRRVSC